jgi:formylglycine-generating enzyme required for sulfatase activity
MQWLWAVVIVALTVGTASAGDPHDGMSPVWDQEACRACHLPTHPADGLAFDADTCGACHGGRLASEDTRVLPPIDERSRAGKSVDKPLAVRENMAQISAGPFIMGYDKRHPDEGPMHTETIEHSYWIDMHEVTNEAYRKFVEATGRPAPDHWRNGAFVPGDERLPVVYVTWYDAHEYCAWAGKRLPTEAEWEKSARGTDGRLFPYGDMFDADKSNSPQAGIGRLMPVGSFPKGRSPYGLYDMAGNVWEWTESWYEAYPGSTHPSPNYGEQYKVVRGGSYVDCSFYRCGLSAPTFNRGFFKRETKNSGFGFRCAQ